MAEKTRILCYRDSLTWGWVPMDNAVPTHRYPYEQRWTGVMAAEIGDGYEIVEEALSGRTTNVDDPTDPRLNGASYLPSSLASHLPLDLVILLVGTNDTKVYFRRSPFEIAAGVSVLIDQIAKSTGGVGTAYPAPQVLLVAPPPLGTMQHMWFRAVQGRPGEERRAGAPLRGARDVPGHPVPQRRGGDVDRRGGRHPLHRREQRGAGEGVGPEGRGAGAAAGQRSRRAPHGLLAVLG